MPLPESLYMPSLESLPQNKNTLILNIAICDGGPQDDILRRHFVNFVRLVDLSVSEYEKTRQFLQESLPDHENRFNAVLSAVDHLELSVITVRRALNAMQPIVRHRQSPPINRTIKRALESFEGPLRDVRDSVVHIEERISSGDMQEGDSHALMVDTLGRTASVGKDTISLERLGIAIRMLHEVASELSVYRELK